MRWLSFRGGCASIIKASSLAHARILATLNDPGQVSRFSEGYSIRADQAALIPANSIGRMLSPFEVRQLRVLLERNRTKLRNRRSAWRLFLGLAGPFAAGP